MAQQTTTISIPATCTECYESDFKKQAPDCWYEKAHHLQNLLKLFKDDFKLDLESRGLDANTIFAELQPKAMQCLIDTKRTAESRIPLMKIGELCDLMSHMKNDIEELKNNRQEINDNFNTKILKSNDAAMDLPTHDVKKEIIVVKKDIKHPKGGWKRYQRNIKKKNLKKYLKKMKEFRPSLAGEIDLVLNGKHSDFIKLGFNKRKNYMISFRDIT